MRTFFTHMQKKLIVNLISIKNEHKKMNENQKGQENVVKWCEEVLAPPACGYSNTDLLIMRRQSR